MTDTIRSRQDDLAAQLAAQHTELMGALADLTAAIAPPPDYSAYFNQLAALIADVLNVLRPAFPAYPTITELLNASNANTQLTYQLVDQLIIPTQNIDSATNALLTSMGLVQSGDYPSLQYKLAAILTYAANISSNTQAIAEPWPANVLAELECLCASARKALPPDPTDPTLEGYCSDPWISTGQVILPWALISGTSQMFAVFDVLPAGLSYGSTFGLTDDHTELDAVDWTGWRVFVQSDQPQYADGGDLLGVARYPTNQWNALTGTNPRAFSVDARGSIKVYLCSPDSSGAPEIPPGECHTFGVTGTDGYAYVIEVPEYPSNYTLRVSMPANVMDSTETNHFLNYGIDWTQEDTGPGPWSVRLGDNRFDAPSSATVTICNPGP